MNSNLAELKTHQSMGVQVGQDINTSGLTPLGHAVLVKTYDPEVRSSVIHIPENAQGRMQMVEQRCVVVAVGSEAWKGQFSESAPRCAPGDKVLVTKFAGYVTNQTKDGESYRLVNDRDIFCRIDWESENV